MEGLIWLHRLAGWSMPSLLAILLLIFFLFVVIHINLFDKIAPVKGKISVVFKNKDLY